MRGHLQQIGGALRRSQHCHCKSPKEYLSIVPQWATRRSVSVNSRRSLWIQNRACAGDGLRTVPIGEVDEEMDFLLPEGSADFSAVLVITHRLARLASEVVEIIVRVQVVVSEIFPYAAVKCVGAALADHVDLYRAFTGLADVSCGGSDIEFRDVINVRIDHRKNRIAGLARLPLSCDSIERDIDGAAGKAFRAALARPPMV